MVAARPVGYPPAGESAVLPARAGASLYRLSVYALRMGDVLDLGHDHELRFMAWKPDRELNPQYDGIPDVERFGASVMHLTPTGEQCMGSITFDGDVQRRIMPNSTFWQVTSWEPLTMTPSLLCQCGDHGFITDGKWVPA